MLKKLFLMIFISFMISSCAVYKEYIGKNRDDILLLLKEKQRKGEKIFMQIKMRDSICCYQFDTVDEIRKRPDIMTSRNWDVFPRKKFLHNGDYYTRLIFEKDSVVSVDPDVVDGFGGPLALTLLWLVSLYHSLLGK